MKDLVVLAYGGRMIVGAYFASEARNASCAAFWLKCGPLILEA